MCHRQQRGFATRVTGDGILRGTMHALTALTKTRPRPSAHWLGLLALTPGLAHANCGSEQAFSLLAIAMYPLPAIVIGTALCLGLLQLIAHGARWQGWLSLPVLTRCSHVCAGVGTAALALFAVLAAPGFQEVFENFGADLPATTGWALSLRWATPLALIGWALGLLRPRWRRQASWSLSWAAFAVLALMLYVFSMYLPLFLLGCAV